MNKILFELPELIRADRILLQIPQAGFGEKLHAAIDDGYEDYIKWLNWPATKPSIQEVEIDCRKHHAEFILRDCIRYLIINPATQEVVGRCAFPSHQANWLIPQFGISYFVRKSYRNSGYARETAAIMSMLAFKVLQARKVSIYCDAENIASCKIPIKLGYQLEYTQKGGWPRQDNKLADLNTYSIFSTNELICPYNISW